ncbi:MAG: hypothetical protein RMM06_11860, partial [Armatimonadota bacterium]|nr:hypothetical protein [Armatimonadota bacterium]
GREHESNRRWLYYKNRYGVNGRVQNWEARDRHNGGSVYVFVDGHARWFHADDMYPEDLKSAWNSTLRYFCKNQRDRDWVISQMPR